MSDVGNKKETKENDIASDTVDASDVVEIDLYGWQKEIYGVDGVCEQK